MASKKGPVTDIDAGVFAFLTISDYNFSSNVYLEALQFDRMSILSHDRRAVSPVVATILLVAVVLVIAGSLSSVIFDFTEEVNEPQEIRFMGETDAVLGVEYRSWDGGGGNETNGDIDHISIQYDHGPVFDGDDIGSIVVAWEGTDGQQGELEFLNPNEFSAQTGQQFHEDVVGDFSTGSFSAGDQLTIRMAHNRYQDGGETDPDEIGEQYVESSWNDISRSGNEAFFRTENRYPIQFRGDRPIDPGDRVTVTFLGPEQTEIVGETTAIARTVRGNATEIEDSELST